MRMKVKGRLEKRCDEMDTRHTRLLYLVLCSTRCYELKGVVEL